MRVAIGADHAGFEMKQDLKSYLRSLGHEVVDMGTDSTESVDYPDFAKAVSMAIVDGKAERGVVICGSGVGACITANKIRGIRAGTCHDNYSARQGVEHSLCLNIELLRNAKEGGADGGEAKPGEKEKSAGKAKKRKQAKEDA